MTFKEPGRNDPCPCASGRKYKQCCLQAHASDDSARLRLRNAEGHVVDTLMAFTYERWDDTLLDDAWEDFWVYYDVPDDMESTPEFESMFIPWLLFGFVPEHLDDDSVPGWPREPIGLHWLAEVGAGVPEVERALIETACRSPLSVFVVEAVDWRSVDIEDVLTGARFHVLDPVASRALQPGDLLFARVLTIDGTSLLLTASPFVIPPLWKTHVVDWRDRLFVENRPDRARLIEMDVEIRELYFDITAGMLDPEPSEPSEAEGESSEPMVPASVGDVVDTRKA